jgi:hypothetical protein
MVSRLALIATVLTTGCMMMSHDGGNLLTVATSHEGVIVSTPPGIECGRCTLTSGCADQIDHTDCDAPFTPGTTVTLSLTEQDVATRIDCISQYVTATDAGDTCSFTFPDGAIVAVSNM